MSDPEAVAKAFTDHYYSTFDNNRSGLAGLYQDQSILTFEGQKFQGTQQITEKLGGLPFQSCQHRVVSLDAQPSVGGGILVFVTGQLLVRDLMIQIYIKVDTDCILLQCRLTGNPNL